MPDTPIPNNEPAGEGPSRPSSRSRLMMATGILLAVVAVIVVVVLLVTGGDDTSDSNDTVAGGSITDVTSPYDVHELPADVGGPGDVKDATLVSISLVTEEGGAAQYYGLSADTEAAQAIIKAVADADEYDNSQGDASVALALDGNGSTLTFLFPDRSTLTFDLYVAAGVIGRGGNNWQVDGDLAALIDAAVTRQ